MSTYQRDGLELHYEVRGAGPAVLCVHGATGTGVYDWSKVADALGDRYRFIIPDLRGHGASDYRAGEMSIEAVNADLLGLIAHEHLEPPHVLAFSFGAEAALDLELDVSGHGRQPDPGEPWARRPEVEFAHTRPAGVQLARHAPRIACGAARAGPLAGRDARALRSGGETAQGGSERHRGDRLSCASRAWAARTTPAACGRRRSCGMHTTGPRSSSSRAAGTPCTRTTRRKSSPPWMHFSSGWQRTLRIHGREASSEDDNAHSRIGNQISAGEASRLAEIAVRRIPRM